MLLILTMLLGTGPKLPAQQTVDQALSAPDRSDSGVADLDPSNTQAFEDPRMLVEVGEIQSVMSDEPNAEETTSSAPSGIDLLTLITRGGIFMIPIGVMSLMVVALAFERLVSLRRQRILPRELEEELEELSEPMDRFDPSAAFHSCLEYTSPAARVVSAMLLRTGQPISEIEQAASETIQREADKCGSPIRWLTLAAAATPRRQRRHATTAAALFIVLDIFEHNPVCLTLLGRSGFHRKCQRQGQVTEEVVDSEF